MTYTRRRMLQRALHLCAAAGMSPAMLGFPARAADTRGYKALVCVFLLGGLDNHDTLIPVDAASYDRYALLRQTLLDAYRSRDGGRSSRDLDQLLALNTVNAADFGSRRFGVPGEMAGIQNLFNTGEASIVANVGPLIEPLRRESLNAPGARVPPRLFSHNDQQSIWMSGQPEGAQFGWGGLFADAVARSSGAANDFLAMTTLGNDVFLTGELARPYQFTPDGAPSIRALERLGRLPDGALGDALVQRLRAHLEAQSSDCRQVIACDYADAMARTISVNERYNRGLRDAVTLGTAFPGGALGSQLGAVARTIAARQSLGAGRQVFFVGLGGFDTHSNQVLDLPRLQQQLSDALVAFHGAIIELGLSREVLLFTASDFGRTLSVNGDGTDHGWGGHHIVLGGGIRGGRVFGEMPPAELDHDLDAGNGRLIPTLAVDQFAASLGRWFGLDDSELARALPGLSGFTTAGLQLHDP